MTARVVPRWALPVVPLALSLALSLAAPLPRAGSGPAAAQQPPASAPARVQVGIEVEPDTVTVGQAFVVSVRVRAPLGAVIRFPDGPDTTHVVQALDPADVRTSGDTAALDQTAYYRVAAWDVGTRPVELAPIAVELDGALREVALEPPTVFVQSVLPEDSTQREPKPARAPWEFPRAWWIPWLIGLIVATIVGLLLWWWWRRRRQRQPLPARRHADPFRDAEERFARVEALRLLEAGERGRYVTLMLDVMRDFLARRFPAASPANTSRELLVALAVERTVPLDRLAGVLHEGDLVKFARRPLTEDRARALGAESRALVRAVHEATLAERAALEAARAATRGRGTPPADHGDDAGAVSMAGNGTAGGRG